MKLFLAIVLTLMLLSLSTGAERSDDEEVSAEELARGFVDPMEAECQIKGEKCSLRYDCCKSLCFTDDCKQCT
nr:conotoxin I3 M6.66 [Conus magus]